MRTLVVLLLILGRFVGDIYTSAGIDRHIRDRQGIGIRDEQGADAVVVDGQFLNPFPVYKVKYLFFLDIQGFLAYQILFVPHFVPHIWRVFTEKFLENFFAEHHKTQVGEGKECKGKKAAHLRTSMGRAQRRINGSVRYFFSFMGKVCIFGSRAPGRVLRHNKEDRKGGAQSRRRFHVLCFFF